MATAGLSWQPIAFPRNCARYDCAMEPKTRRDCLPELDGLRAVLVWAVLIGHLGYGTKGFTPPFLTGPAAVSVFFTLSGFLITRILLYNREQGIGIGDFMARRAVRILPVAYIGVLAVLLVWGPSLRLLSVATYTFNYAWPQVGGTPNAHAVNGLPVDHFWSLCVEEHFYLAWPWVVLFMSRRNAHAIACLIVPLSFAFAWWSNFAAIQAGDSLNAWQVWINGATHYRMGGLAIGALAAFHEQWLRKHPRVVLGVAVVALACILLHRPAIEAMSANALGWLPLRVLIERSAVGVLYFALALWCGFGAGWKPLQALLADSAMVYVGRISYGLYVYHMPIFAMIDTTSLIARFACVSTAFAAAALSYRYIETPLRQGAVNWLDSRRTYGAT